MQKESEFGIIVSGNKTLFLKCILQTMPPLRAENESGNEQSPIDREGE
jgi:hypothetical protein